MRGCEGQGLPLQKIQNYISKKKFKIEFSKLSCPSKNLHLSFRNSKVAKTDNYVICPDSTSRAYNSSVIFKINPFIIKLQNFIENITTYIHIPRKISKSREFSLLHKIITFSIFKTQNSKSEQSRVLNFSRTEYTIFGSANS